MCFRKLEKSVMPSLCTIPKLFFLPGVCACMFPFFFYHPDVFSAKSLASLELFIFKEINRTLRILTR